MKTILLLVLFFHAQVFAALKAPSGEWPLKFDSYFSARSGSSIISSVNNALFWSEDQLIEQASPIDQPWSGILRTLELGLLVLPINDVLFLWQHEFFGHGARAREFGLETSWPEYHSWPLPYGAGLAAISHNDANNELQELLIILGGVEGASVLADDINMNSWRHKKIYAKSSFMQILASQNITGYLWIFSPETMDENLRDGHDMVSYVKAVNKMYGTEKLNLSYLNWSVAANLLDPYFYLSFYSMYKYVIDGSPNNSFPYFSFGQGVSYLPGVRYILSPFGPEYHLNNYLTIFDRNLLAYIRYGSLSDTKFYGLGAKGDVYRYKDLNVGAELHLWRQPQMLSESFGDAQFGIYCAMLMDYQPVDFLSLNGQVGYKTPGYVLGERIDSGFIWRAGLTWKL